MHEPNYLNVVALIMMAAMTGHTPVDARIAESQTALARFDANFAWPQGSGSLPAYAVQQPGSSGTTLHAHLHHFHRITG